MFFGAIARPHPKKQFDGRILLKPIVEEKEMLRSSKYAKKGEIVDEPTTMTKASFIELCSTDLLKAISEAIKKHTLNVSKVVVQMDQAGMLRLDFSG